MSAFRIGLSRSPAFPRMHKGLLLDLLVVTVDVIKVSPAVLKDNSGLLMKQEVKLGD